MSNLLHRPITPSSLRTSSSDEKVSEAFEKGGIRDNATQKENSSRLTNEESRLTGSIIAQGPEAERLAKQYAETLSRHSRLNPDNNPSFRARFALILLVMVLFWYAIQSRLRVIEWKRSLHTEPYDENYADMSRLSPMAEDSEIPLNYDIKHIEL